MSTYSILSLDDYSILRLFEHITVMSVASYHELDSRTAICLSCTCRRLRELAMPVLFGRCRQVLGNSVGIASDESLVPCTLWPHIRTITLSCRCVDSYPMEDQWGHDIDKPQDSDVICGALAIPSLCHALHNMPRLSEVVIRPEESHVYGHGLTWETLCGLLSLPHLTRLVLDRIHVCPIPPENTATPLVNPHAPLTCLEYRLPNIRYPYSLSSEVDALDRMLRSFHLSLETLSLPSEPAPLHIVPLLDWPRLRELRLRGIHWTSPHDPIINLFACMPNLRVLSLELMEQASASAIALWPRGFRASYPWPYLDSLSVSHPDPEDEIYEHLPSTMQTLELRPWPHLCIRRWQEVNYEPEQLRSYSPPPSPSVLLRILSRCYMPHLQTLGIEYCSDSTELSLLSHITSNFCLLTTLELHRYRSDGDMEIPMLDIARPLASLSNLRILKIHLDFPGAPAPWYERSGKSYTLYNSALPNGFEHNLLAAATTFVRMLSPSLQEVWQLLYQYFQIRWRIFDVVHDDMIGERKVQMDLGVQYGHEWVWV
ncbi:hypothetical protein L226DRAFT_616927 [Lentinus tigrinus ALCF2SS1-7]|uniref:F-box domain-containing protein n=1 Tax=Lentinus tigrinus ALCF2SS1-6 TaxID=1328759 RepID=A0A5C2RRU8_9APHY|nr:hypothetical protein L227DRAFT_556520 [Lentinus tigrinus ALCF2SS1-6]RPD69234.1 hypothetical protein L226DRAFT_616927 [Lentinus tigrinus ALCF2SS1-7]